MQIETKYIHKRGAKKQAGTHLISVGVGEDIRLEELSLARHDEADGLCNVT